MTVPTAICLVGAVVAVAYGLIDLLVPGVAIRRQMQATNRSSGTRQSVGREVQRLFGVSNRADAERDTYIRTKVRIAGGLLVLFGAGMVVAAIALFEK
jgi:hypothetical protein